LIGPGTPFSANPSGFTGPFGFFPLELEVVEGNPALDSESAVTYTLGVVLSRNSWNLAVDLYDIDIKNAIAPLDSTTAYERCFNSNGTSNPTYSPTNEFCQLIVRDPVTGGRQQVDAPYLNLGGIQTSGVDVQANWQGERLSVNFMVNYLNEYKTQTTPGSPFFEAAGTLAQGGQYDYRTYTTVGYNLNDALNFGLRWRHLPSVEDESAATDPTTSVQGTDSYNIFDFYGGWRVNDTVSVRFGIDNLLDEEPEIVGFNPPLTNARGNTAPGFYDPLGRRAYVGVKLSF
jgi:outer membrane receptor protein involved in Fe transport